MKIVLEEGNNWDRMKTNDHPDYRGPLAPRRLLMPRHIAFVVISFRNPAAWNPHKMDIWFPKCPLRHGYDRVAEGKTGQWLLLWHSSKCR